MATNTTNSFLGFHGTSTPYRYRGPHNEALTQYGHLGHTCYPDMTQYNIQQYSFPQLPNCSNPTGYCSTAVARAYTYPGYQTQTAQQHHGTSTPKFHNHASTHGTGTNLSTTPISLTQHGWHQIHPTNSTTSWHHLAAEVIYHAPPQHHHNMTPSSLQTGMPCTQGPYIDSNFASIISGAFQAAMTMVQQQHNGGNNTRGLQMSSKSAKILNGTNQFSLLDFCGLT